MLIKGNISSVTVHDAYYYEDEVRYVVNEIAHLINKENYDYSDIAILYRNNALSRNFELGLIENKMPYRLFGGFSYLKRKEIKDFVSKIEKDFIGSKKRIDNAILSPASEEDELRLAMEMARRAIDSVKSVGEIAEECAFTDSSYFTKAFKAEFGLTPKAYRNEIAEELI